MKNASGIPADKPRPGRIKKKERPAPPIRLAGFADSEETAARAAAFAGCSRARVVLLQELWNKNTLTVLAAALSERPDLPFEISFAPYSAVVQAAAGASRDFPLVLAFSFHTPNLRFIAERAAAARAASKGLPALLLAGGAHASGDPEGALELGFDFVIAGEAEESLPLFLEELAQGGCLDEVPGLVRRDSGVFRRGPPPAPVDLEKHPPLAERLGRIAPLEISRGCPFGCAYCQTTALMGPVMRHRSVERLAPWIRTAREMGMYDLRLLSPNAFAYGSRDGRTPDLDATAGLLLEANRVFGREHTWFGCFPCEVRPEAVTLEGLRLVRKFAVNNDIVMGAQSGSDRMLREIGRGHHAEDVILAVEKIVEQGFRPVVDFIFGLPGETVEDRAATRAVIERITSLGAVIHSHAFMPLPGTKLWRSAPSPLDPETTRFLGELGRWGRQFGQWQEQQKKAKTSQEIAGRDKKH